MDDENVAVEPAQESPGAILHHSRRRQNMSVGDVSRHLKLSVRQVEALERDQFEVFGGRVFVHGFLRNYAKLLGLDASTLIAAADQCMGIAASGSDETIGGTASMSAASQGEVSSKPKRLLPVVSLVVIVIAIVAGWMLMHETRSVERVDELDSDSSIVRLPDEDRPAVEAVAMTEPGAEIAPQAPVAATPRETTRNVVASVPEKVVVMVFRQESWVEISDRHGETVFSRLSPPGASYQIRAQPPLVVVIGNAVGVDLIYDGEVVDLEPYTRVDVARLNLE